MSPSISLDADVGEASGGGVDGLLQRLSQCTAQESRYEIEGEIARGGMGAILKVRDVNLRRPLAMKVVLGTEDKPRPNETPGTADRVLARFLEEAQVTGQLDHPGIVPVHELGVDADGRVYFTMKLVKGRDLKRIFDLVFEGEEGWNETRALSVILKVCEAMAYAHVKGVIHRDLKPANVMVGNFGEVFVMDWGLARVLGRKDTHDIRIRPEFTTSLGSLETDRRAEREEKYDSPILTMDGDVVGTPAYMSPEQARGETERLTPRSDVYAIGAMLYHLLARSAPYLAPGSRVSKRTILGMVLQGPPLPLLEVREDLPVELVAICEKAMARDPSDRYADTLELAEDLRAYLEQRVVRAYEGGSFAELKKWIVRNRALASAVAGAAVILVAGVVSSTLFAVDAKEQAGIATRTSNEVFALSTMQELEDLVQRADALWPAFPERLADYDRWLEDARMLVDGRAADPARGISAHPSLKDHQAKLAEIRTRARPRATLVAGADPDAERAWQFEDPKDAWWHGQLSQLVADLGAFADPTTGLMSSGTSKQHGWGIARRRSEAATIAERSVGSDEAKRLWSAATAAISKSDRYGGLILTPQTGLFPLGMDPDSHLFEFAHVQTGVPPRRDENGKLVMTEESCVVLVLIPGGTFTMGAQKETPGEPNYDASALDSESPPHEVKLGPYFLSKHEMTQGQWVWLMGNNPSLYSPRNHRPDWSRPGVPFDLLHPVEQVSWIDCNDALRRIGAVLPTEAQWEHGARAGTRTPWWTGAEDRSLDGAANLADRYAKEHGGNREDYDLWLDDGNTAHARVGSYQANAFGLHDVIGNVWELCRDDAAPYGQRARDGDGERGSVGTEYCSSRGGCFFLKANVSRSALRGSDSIKLSASSTGVRPAMEIRPSR